MIDGFGIDRQLFFVAWTLSAAVFYSWLALKQRGRPSAASRTSSLRSGPVDSHQPNGT